LGATIDDTKPVFSWDVQTGLLLLDGEEALKEAKGEAVPENAENAFIVAARVGGGVLGVDGAATGVPKVGLGVDGSGSLDTRGDDFGVWAGEGSETAAEQSGPAGFATGSAFSTTSSTAGVMFGEQDSSTSFAGPSCSLFSSVEGVRLRFLGGG